MADSKKRKQGKLWMTAVVTAVAVMAAIVWFSSQSAAESSAISKGLAGKLMAIFPALEDVVTLSKLNHYLRKLAHFTLYFVLGCSLTGVASRQQKVHPVLVSILIGTVFAMTDEIHQFFSENRGPMIQDVLLDACGVAAGSIFVTLCKKLFDRRRSISKQC